jgi:hypothetical protein
MRNPEPCQEFGDPEADCLRHLNALMALGGGASARTCPGICPYEFLICVSPDLVILLHLCVVTADAELSSLFGTIEDRGNAAQFSAQRRAEWPHVTIVHDIPGP